jgi:lipopolysaccharide export system permease protein
VLDLLNTSDELLRPAGAGQASLLRYFELRWPQAVSQFSPFAALLAVLTVLSGLSGSNEVTAMRAGGLSAMRVIAPFVIGCGLLSAAHFGFHELVSAPAAARLAVWKDNAYDPRFARTGEVSDLATNAFISESGLILKASKAVREGDRATLEDVTVYQRDAGQFAMVMHAPRGAVGPDGFFLEEVRALDLATRRVESLPRVQLSAPISVDRLFVRARNPEEISLPELLRLMRSMRAEGSPARELETVFWRRLTRPLASLVMPFMAAVAGFGLTRHGGALARLLAGAALGFSFFVFDNVLAALGELGVMDPIFAAFAPPLIYAGVGIAFVLSSD